MSQLTVSDCLPPPLGNVREQRVSHVKVAATTAKPYITIDWPGASRPEKAKALAIIDAVIHAAGVTPEQAAVFAGVHKNEEFNDMYGKLSTEPTLEPGGYDAAQLWDDLSVIVAVAMGWDVDDSIRAQRLDIRLEAPSGRM